MSSMIIRSCTFATCKSSPLLSLPSLETSIVENSGPETKTLVSFLNLKIGYCYICGFAAFVLRTLRFGLFTTLAKVFSMVIAIAMIISEILFLATMPKNLRGRWFSTLNSLWFLVVCLKWVWGKVGMECV